LGVGRSDQKERERYDEAFGIAGLSAVKPSRRREDHSAMVLAGSHPGPHNTVEVLDVLSHHGPAVRSGLAQELFVWKARQPRKVGCREHVVAACSESLGR
jgi:hypothetical protein